MSGFRLAFLSTFLLSACLEVIAQEHAVKISEVVVIGNRRTKDFVVKREIALKAGDTVRVDALDQLAVDAQQTLTNTSLFNFAEVSHTFLDSQRILVEVKVQERWYIWPGIVFSLAETNFNSWWQNKDFGRINYGLYVQDMNFRGRREVLTFHFQSGWKRMVGLNYMIPGLNKKRTIGAGLDVYYANNREVNYGSSANERQFFRDDRFIQEEIRVGGTVDYRKHLFNRHRFNLGMNTVIIDDTVKTYSTSYLPGDHLRSQYLFLSYGFKREKRDNIGYPLKGYVVDLTLDQEGLGILNEDDIMLSEAFLTVNMHSKLGGRWYYAFGVKGKSTLLNANDVPYYYQRGLGYSNAFIRGYELYVIDGQHYALYKSNLKFNLLKKRTLDAGMGGIDSFDKFHYSLFLNAFADAGYVVDNINPSSNPLANAWQYSAGLGLDFVTYYDIVIRFEGSINKQGVPGFFIHFKNPI